MQGTMIDVTPSKYWASLNRVLNRETFWTVIYDSINNYGEDWFDDDYETKQQALKSAQDYFNFECQEIVFEEGLPKLLRTMPVTLAQYFYFNDERRYIHTENTTIHYEYYKD